MSVGCEAAGNNLVRARAERCWDGAQKYMSVSLAIYGSGLLTRLGEEFQLYNTTLLTDKDIKRRL